MPTVATEQAFDTFLGRQRAMYGGGELDAVGALLTEDVVWHVPGTSAIAGDHRGRDAVLEYFARRRALAGGRMKIVERARLTSDDTFVQLADGETELDGEHIRWRRLPHARRAGRRGVARAARAGRVRRHLAATFAARLTRFEAL